MANTFDDLLKLIQEEHKSNKSNPSSHGLEAIARIVATSIAPIGLGVFATATAIAPLAYLGVIKSKDLESTRMSNSSGKFAYDSTKLGAFISRINVANSLVGATFIGFATSQILFSNSLSLFAGVITHSNLKKFNSIDFAVKHFSKSFLIDVSKHKKWDEIEIVNEVNETLIEASEIVLEKNKNVTAKDLDILKNDIINRLNELSLKTKSERARIYIVDLITVLGFLLTLYSVNSLDINEELDIKFIRIQNEISENHIDLNNKIEFKLDELNKLRFARTDVNLRVSSKRKAKIISVVQKGQKVHVIEVFHKHILIAYLDQQTSLPYSGFVMKKYFESDN